MNLQRCYSRIRLLRSSAVLLVSIILLSGVSISLASSFLDPSFGTNGVTITSLDGSAGGASVAIQTDGKIVVAGGARDGADVASRMHFALVRYTMSGTLDTAFGAQGVVTTAVSTKGQDAACAVAIQPDGKLVAAGYSNEGPWGFLALARYTTTGTLDPEFGVGGVVTTPIGQAGGAYAVAIQPDGKIVVAGGAGVGYAVMVVARYTITGSLDSGFENRGVGLASVSHVAARAARASLGLTPANDPVPLSPGFYTSASSVVIQPDHKIVVAGGADGQIILVRMNQNGSWDTTFGTGGQVLTSVPGSSYSAASAVGLQTDGKIVVAGSSALNYKYNFLAARYSITGALDSAFGSSGIVTTSLGPGGDNGHSVAVQPDGRIVVGGISNDGVRYNFALVRYLSSGAPDPLWGIGGVVTSSVGASFSAGNSVALQADGKIVLGGWSSDDGIKTDFAVARYLAGISTHFLYLPVIRKG